MLHHLDNLRKRSHTTRRNIALFSSAILTLTMFSVWWSTWSVGAVASNQSQRTEKISKEISPTRALASTFSAGKEGVSGAFSALSESLKSLSSTSTAKESADMKTKTNEELDYRLNIEEPAAEVPNTN